MKKINKYDIRKEKEDNTVLALKVEQVEALKKKCVSDGGKRGSFNRYQNCKSL